jgi:NitT/TauT family transport system permease protein
LGQIGDDMETKAQMRARGPGAHVQNSKADASQAQATSASVPKTNTGNLTGGATSTQSTYIDQSEGIEERAPSKGRRFGANLLVGLVLLALLVGVWWLVVIVGNYPPYILPTPVDVAERTWSMLLDGSLAGHFGVTVLEAGLGFLLALVLGIGIGYPLAHSHLLERLVSPYIAISQGLPVVAIAPLLIIWIRDDLTRKVVIVALIVFFPILVNTIVGLRSIDRSMYEVAKISGANRLQTIRFVELPLGLRPLLAGIKLGLTLAITGAVIGELIAPRSGLGFLLVLGQNLFDTTLIFVGLVSLAFLAVVVYMGMTLLERALINWE